jgi:hypothetical protein
METNEFDLIFMTFDGDYVKDSSHSNLEEAEKAFSEIGSKWFFYPFGFILRGTKVIESGEGLIRMKDHKAFSELMFKGRKLTTVVKTFKKTLEYCEKTGIEVGCDEFECIMIDNFPELIR